MKNNLVIAALMLLSLAVYTSAQKAVVIRNPSIDMKEFLRMAKKAAEHRESRRLTEAEFIKASGEPGVVILDARSKEKFDELHIAGAMNLSFPDFTVENLGRMLPNKDTKILIYCNNNFIGAERAFPTKVAPASLNLSTYVALYTYGYRNVYELGPLLDARTTRIELKGSK